MIKFIRNILKKRFEKQQQTALEQDSARRQHVIDRVKSHLEEEIGNVAVSVNVECYYGDKLGYQVNDVYLVTVEFYHGSSSHLKRDPFYIISKSLHKMDEKLNLYLNGPSKYNAGVGKITCKYWQEFWPKDQWAWDKKMKPYK